MDTLKKMSYSTALLLNRSMACLFQHVRIQCFFPNNTLPKKKKKVDFEHSCIASYSYLNFPSKLKRKKEICWLRKEQNILSWKRPTRAAVSTSWLQAALPKPCIWEHCPDAPWALAAQCHAHCPGQSVLCPLSSGAEPFLTPWPSPDTFSHLSLGHHCWENKAQHCPFAPPIRKA